MAAGVTAILIEAIASLRLEADADVWHLPADFARASPFGVVLTLALVAAAEAMRTPFAWLRALLSIGCYALVSACALTIVALSDRAFVHAFRTT